MTSSHEIKGPCKMPFQGTFPGISPGTFLFHRLCWLVKATQLQFCCHSGESNRTTYSRPQSPWSFWPVRWDPKMSRSHIFVKIWIVNSATGCGFSLVSWKCRNTRAPRLFCLKERIWSSQRRFHTKNYPASKFVEIAHMRSFLDLKKIPRLKN